MTNRSLDTPRMMCRHVFSSMFSSASFFFHPYATYVRRRETLRSVTLSRGPPCRGGRRRFLYGWLLSLSLAGDWTELSTGPSLLHPPGPPSTHCCSVNMAKHACSCPCHHLPVGFLRFEVSRWGGQPRVPQAECQLGTCSCNTVGWSTACTTSRVPIGNQRRFTGATIFIK